MEDAFQLAVKSNGDDTDWCMYLEDALLNSFFFASDFVLIHGMANVLGEADVNEAHRKLLGDVALSPMTFRHLRSASLRRSLRNISASWSQRGSLRSRILPISRICAFPGLEAQRTFRQLAGLNKRACCRADQKSDSADVIYQRFQLSHLRRPVP
jgi:hypothetical protein